LARILLISNGHGEDLSGSLLGKKLIEMGNQVEAFALVGKGNAYRKERIRNRGLGREFSTGGIGYTSLKGRFTELIQGQLIYLIRNFIKLLIIAKYYDLLVVVGDIVPIFAAWLTRRPSVVYLVAYSSYYEGKLRLPWPCKDLLNSNIFKEIYCRDKLTSEDLNSQLLRSTYFLGNPFMDQVFTPELPLPQVAFRLGLLPGSRRPELDSNLILILKVLLLLPADIFSTSRVSIDIALVGSLDRSGLTQLLSKYGWSVIDNYGTKSTIKLVRKSYKINIYRDSFEQVVQSSTILLAMAGTATEQAVGLGKPVIQLPGKGPQFTSEFAEAQRRLLGPTVFCAEENLKESKDLLLNTARLIVKLYSSIGKDSELASQCLMQAEMRLGRKGGSERIAESINNICFNLNN